MVWGTFFKSDISLHRENFTSKLGVEDDIDELNIDIKDIESRIKMYTTVSLKEIIPEDWGEEPINWISIRINELLKSYTESIIKRYKLELYLEYINERPEHNFEIDHE